MEKAQVLIVEDDAIIAMDIESQLKQLGYGVTAKVAYGEKVIEKVKENAPDLVLMDIILKGEMDGIEAAEEIHTQFDIPVIFLTAYADKNRLKRAKLANPYGYILKPFQDKDLEVTIEMALYVAKVDAKRRKAEEALRQTQKLESLGTLTGGIAHDFNNLLSIIMGNIELAIDDLKPEAYPNSNLREAKKASLKAKELANQLIAFSKGGAPVKEVRSIANLVKETVNLILSESNVKSELFMSSDLYTVEFDQGQMKLAVKNLIVNAVEAMPDGGSIAIKAENFDNSSETPDSSLPLPAGKYVKISIQDHGAGIPAEHLSKIFDPYFSTNEIEAQRGVGLGLAITYSIISKHGGCTTVESGAGVGTTFTIYLPALEKSTVDLKPVQKSEIRTGRILVMDDEEKIRNLANQVLSRLGYEPVLAADGAETIELYKIAIDSGKPFDAVILDLTIKEGAGGKEVIKQLMEINPDVKAIVSSGYFNDPVMTDFRKYDFIGALAKPYTIKDLSDSLNKVAEQ